MNQLLVLPSNKSLICFKGKETFSSPHFRVRFDHWAFSESLLTRNNNVLPTQLAHTQITDFRTRKKNSLQVINKYRTSSEGKGKKKKKESNPNKEFND